MAATRLKSPILIAVLSVLLFCINFVHCQVNVSASPAPAPPTPPPPKTTTTTTTTTQSTTNLPPATAEPLKEKIKGPAAPDSSLPYQYPEQKAPVLTDLVISGLIFCFCILGFSFYIAFPGIRGNEKVFTYIRFTVSIFIGAFILVCNFGQSWEVAEIATKTQYKAVEPEHISAKVGVYIGLRGVNVTLTGKPVNQLGERIDYNERFSWEWGQGRRGFGPRAGRFNREFRAAQYKGLPYPVLWIAEYFTFDGEGIRFGRHYRLAGWYAHIMIWTAFPLWLLTNILLFVVIQYGAISLILTGASLLASNILFASIRNPIPLEIPFEDEWIVFQYGWCFWLNLFTGLLCAVLGVVIFIVDLRLPDETATFFGISVLQEYEDFYADPSELSVQKGREFVQITKIPTIFEEPPEPSSETAESQIYQTVHGMRRRTLSIRFQKSGLRKPAAMPRKGLLKKNLKREDSDQPVYENIAAGLSTRFDPIGEEDISMKDGNEPILMKDF